MSGPPESVSVRLRRLAPHEADLHRRVRLRALGDAPESFGEAYADVAARPPSYWEALTRSVTEPSLQIMVLACRDEAVVGSAYGLSDRERPDAGRVGGMWVEPGWRGRGVGQALLQHVLGWARDRGFARVGLWAPAASAAAIALYSRAGFRATGERRPLRADSASWIVAMELEL